MGIASILGGLIDKEQVANDMITNILTKVAEEHNCSHKDFFIMIAPKNADYEFALHLYRITNGQPQRIKTLQLTELINDE